MTDVATAPRARSRARLGLAVFVAVAVLAAGARALYQSRHGLAVENFAATEWSPARTRWFGYLTVSRSGDVTFATASGTLTLDGRVLVQAGQADGTARPTAHVSLDRGSHFVLVEYAQYGAPLDLAWVRGREEAGDEPVPWRVLTPGRVPYWRPLLLASLDWLVLVALGGAAVIVGRTVWSLQGARVSTVVRRYPNAASLALFVGLAVLHTWPLATRPGVLSRNDNGDTLLNEWALAWFAHQAPRAPLKLFEANIYYPEPHTLAYSEAMIVQSAMAAPIQWLGGSPVLAYNLVLLAGYALTGWATCLVVRRWTGTWGAGLAAGLIFGFNAHTLTRMPHLQTQHVEFLPLALMALDGVLREPGTRHALRLALWFALQALTSIYLLVFSTFALAAAAVARPEWYTSRRFLKVAPYLALAALVAGVVLVPYLLPYWQLSRDPWFTRPLRDASQYSASWGDYLAAPGRIHFEWWSRRFWTGDGLFPGVVALAMAGIAIVRGVAFADRRARMCLAAGAAAVYLSFGTRAPGYAALYGAFPVLGAIRAPVRFGHIALLAVAVLAGFGMAEIHRRVTTRVWTPLLVAVLALVTVETMVAPVWFTPFTGIPAIYAQVRNHPRAVVVELPLPEATFHNARTMLHSTAHFKPMLNGYSGFVPRSYFEHREMLDGFPDAKSLDALRALGVTHAFVHTDDYSPEVVASLEQSGAFQRVAADAELVLYALMPSAGSH